MINEPSLLSILMRIQSSSIEDTSYARHSFEMCGISSFQWGDGHDSGSYLSEALQNLNILAKAFQGIFLQEPNKMFWSLECKG